MAAAQVLKQNDRGGYSIPAGGIYPMQFNWDSAFAAIGYGCLNDGTNGARAWQELEMVTEAQKADGMIPHIIFRGDYHGYFPGPDIWQAGGNPPTSGITNPPVMAIAANILRRRHKPPSKKRYRKLLSSIAKWHKWMADICLHQEHNAFTTAHPWETGRDNACDWDNAMATITPHGINNYQRSDTQFVNKTQRPHKKDYDRFLTIVASGAKHQWNQKTFRAQSPFTMLDPGITAILAAASDSLEEMLTEEKMDDELKLTNGIAARARKGLTFLWNDTVSGYTPYNPKTKKHINTLSNASFLAPLAGINDDKKHQQLMQTLDRFLQLPHAVASCDPTHKSFSPQRYWRGPIWLPMNLLITEGLKKTNEHPRAQKIIESSLNLTTQNGFREYYNPQTGEGLGGKNFTWTAASTLHFLNH